MTAIIIFPFPIPLSRLFVIASDGFKVNASPRSFYVSIFFTLSPHSLKVIRIYLLFSSRYLTASSELTYT